MVIANFFGTSVYADSFNLAYLFTGNFFIIFGCIGGPFYSSIVAVLPSLKLSDRHIKIFIKEILIKITFALALLTVAMYFLKPYLLSFFIDKASKPEYFDLTLLNIDFLLPLILICGPIGLISGVLNIYKKYYEPSLAPGLMNLFLIAAVFIMGDSYNGIALALGGGLGGLASLAFQFPSFSRVLKGLNLSLDSTGEAKNLIDPNANASYWQILFPALLSTAMSQLVVFVDSFFCKELVEGSWTAVVMANRLIQMPLGVLLTAFMVPLYPRVSELVSLKDFNGIKKQVSKALFLLMLFCIPATLIGAIWAEPLIKLIFQRGAFDAASTELVASVFFWLSFTIIPYVLRDTATRIFYSFGDARTPTLVMLGAVLLKIVLNSFLVPQFQVSGIAISTIIVSLINFSVLLGIGLFIKTK